MFRSEKDPMLEVMGRGIDSHPQEIEEMLKKLKEWGVDLVESKALGYGTSARGNPGAMSITDNASYSAWLHQFQHVEDAQKNGWDAAFVLYCDEEERIAREKRAYQKEIDLANELGYTDMVKRLEKLLEDEIRKIQIFFHSEQ